jgi:glycosyltransferase involved in cell wall biosynthesis
MDRIVLLGRYPPPVGGNTTHVERLSYRLIRDGLDVTVVDLYRPSVWKTHGKRLEIAFDGGDSPHTALARAHCLGLLSSASEGSILHVHISAGKRFYAMSPVLAVLSCRARKRVLTIHSGSWLQEFERLSPISRWAAIRFLASFDDVICVNELQKQRLSGRIHSHVHVIPAYLPCPTAGDRELPAAVRALKRDCDFLVVTSGYGTPIYDYATLIRAVEMAQAQTSSRLALVLATYCEWDDDYWPGIESLLEQTPIRATVTTALDALDFAHLLANAQLYVRPTLTDGDAVAIRESASLGVRVLASDSVPRPAGCALFPAGNARALADLIVSAIRFGDIGRLETKEIKDSYFNIINIYIDSIKYLS